MNWTNAIVRGPRLKGASATGPHTRLLSRSRWSILSSSSSMSTLLMILPDMHRTAVQNSRTLMMPLWLLSKRSKVIRIASRIVSCIL